MRHPLIWFLLEEVLAVEGAFWFIVIFASICMYGQWKVALVLGIGLFVVLVLHFLAYFVSTGFNDLDAV